jgi:hypothetical protein
MSALYTLSVWVHVLAACAWVGSMIFFATAVVPVVRRPEFGDVSARMVRELGARFRVVGWTSLLVLVATGVANLTFAGIGPAQLTSTAFWSAGFGRTLAFKLSAVLLVVIVTAVHDALSTKRDARRVASWLGRVVLVLSVVVVLLAVWLVRGMPL